MSWESYTLMRCKNCGKIYEVEDSTLIMNQEGYINALYVIPMER